MPETPSPVALVSGGSRGIGRAVVRRLAEDGYDVAFCYVSAEEPARELEKEIAGLGRRAVATRVDVTDAEAVRAWVRETGSELGPIDAVVTSAGVTRDSALVLMADEDWHTVLDINLDGMYNVCRSAIFDMMKSRSGVIVNLSSVAGVKGHARQTNYAAAKAGIIGFTKATAKELASFGVTVNAISPNAETRMIDSIPPDVRANIEATIPMGRFGEPTEMAAATAFLASAEAGYVTGVVLPVDGGLAM